MMLRLMLILVGVVTVMVVCEEGREEKKGAA